MEFWILQRWGHVKSKNELIEQQVPAFAIFNIWLCSSRYKICSSEPSFFLFLVFVFISYEFVDNFVNFPLYQNFMFSKHELVYYMTRYQCHNYRF